MTRWVRSLLAGTALAALAAPAPALAQRSPDASPLIVCDGRGIGPTPVERQLGGMAVLASEPVIGKAEAFDRSRVRPGEPGVAACDDALRDARVAANPVRRAELMLARAIHNVEEEHYDAAVLDADAALAVPMPALVRARFDRTIAPSLLLVKALARAAQGRQAEAEALADAAARLRPWSDLIVQSATLVMGLSPAISPAEAALLDRLHRLKPASYRIDALVGDGQWRAAAADAEQLLMPPGAVSPLRYQSRLAALLALAGQTQRAESAAVTAAGLVAAAGADEPYGRARDDYLYGREMLQLARVQIALNLGRVDEARSQLQQLQRWAVVPDIGSQVVANFEAMAGGPVNEVLSAANARAIVARMDRLRVSGPRLRFSLMAALPRWQDLAEEAEQGRQLLPQTGAPTVTRRKDGLAFTITPGKLFDESSVREMLLLAAARAAAARGADRFAVVRTNIADAGIAGTRAMVKASLDFVLPDDALFASQASRALMVAEVEAGLGAAFAAAAAQR